MRHMRLRPVDTWFFRGSTPFTAEASPQEGVRSLFPPHPPTVAGALRAAIARSNGWSGSGRWDAALHYVVGNGPDDLGALSFAGPFLLRDGEPLFRCPRHLLGVAEDRKWVPRAFLRPGPPVQCDLGDDVRLPQLAERAAEGVKLKPSKDHWLKAAGMERVLRGCLPSPDDLIATSTLWTEEPRIGLERQGDTRTAKDGMLYSTRHVRLRGNVSLGAGVAGVPDRWRLPEGLVPLGGESRLAECTEWTGAKRLDQPLGQAGSRFAVVAVTPVDLDPAVVHERRTIAELGGARVVSACLDRSDRIGGWDSGARRPLPLRNVLAPGSVLFSEGADGTRLDTIGRGALGLFRIGSRTEWGFGLVAIGKWPADKEKNKQ